MNDDVDLLIPLSAEMRKANEERVEMLNQLRAHGFNMVLSTHQVEHREGRMLLFTNGELAVTIRNEGGWYLRSYFPKCPGKDFRIEHADLETVLKIARFANIID